MFSNNEKKIKEKSVEHAFFCLNEIITFFYLYFGLIKITNYDDIIEYNFNQCLEKRIIDIIYNFCSEHDKIKL